MSFKRQVAYNTTVQVIGKAIVTLLSVFVTILLTRHLGPTGYGYYNTAVTFVGFFIVLADLGVYPILVREMSQRPEERERIYGNIVVYRTLSALLVMLLAFLVGSLMPYPQIVKFAIGIYALASFFGLLVNLVMAVFQINYRMDLPTISDVLGRALYLFLLFFGLQRGYGLYGIFWLLVLTTIFNLILNLVLGRRYIKFKPAFEFPFIKEFFKESLPMGLVTILGMIHFKIDTILLSVMKPAYDVGLYGAAYRIFENLIIIPGIFVGLMFPKFSELYIQDRNILKNTFQKTIDILILAVMPILILFFLLSPYLIQIIAGSDFAPSALALRILVFSLPFTFLISPFSYLLVASKKQTRLIYVWGAMSILNIVLNLIYIPKYSYRGAAAITVVTEMLTLITLYILVNKSLNIWPKFGYLFKIILPSLILGIGFYFLSKSQIFNLTYFINHSLIIQIIIVIIVLLLGLLIFLALLLLFRVIRKDEILEIIKIRQ